MATANTSAVGKLSREEFRRQKDLDAARKAGTAPAALDEEGKAINPHIPQYISQAPWYLDTGKPSLAHQRRPVAGDEPSSTLDEPFARGQKAGPAATKYRKGACENCGAMTHKRQDCLERPRKKGAKFTGKDIQADEIIQDVKAGYAAKRDRWSGYDPAEHKRIYDEYAAIEEARQKLREEEIDNQTTTDLAAVRKVAKAKTRGDDEFGSSDEEDEDEDKYADAADAVGQKMDTKTRITVRNLRIREDTAKYLRNLDPESAYYDPKTRSMREAPDKNVPAEEALFAGDNFLRHTGEAVDVEKLQLFAWQSAARGNDVHLHANPTAGEILHQEYKEKKEKLKDTNKVGILAKYGGAEYLQRVSKELLTGQTEEYVEYSRTGQVVKGRERVKHRSKYAEDVLINNHTAVWGSFYDLTTGTWGYGCCHSTMHASYCAGEAAIAAAEASSAQNLLVHPPPSDREREKQSRSMMEQHLERISRKGKDKERDLEEPSSLAKKHLGEGDIHLDKDKLADAIKAEREKKRKVGRYDDDEAPPGKRKKYQDGFSSSNQEVTEEELEAYRMNRRAGFDDPMFGYVDKEA
ncbi:Pre-mRNA splicing Prp18-interacting factor-domain-containing protein [Hysterangium stoloniferum]|nr:Pre-mRNA splicing Prp18-interacting factor-domain-containing protein [Hysterangium stoloniferum]